MGTKIPISIAGNLVADPELTIGESGVPTRSSASP